MHKYESTVLNLLKSHGKLSTEELAKLSKLGKDELLWAIESLSAQSLLVTDYTIKRNIVMSNEGAKYSKSMLPEDELLEKLQNNALLKVSEITDEKNRIAMQWCIKKGTLKILDKSLIITEKGKAQKIPSSESKFLKDLSEKDYSSTKLSSVENTYLNEFVQRGLVTINEKKLLSHISLSKKGTETSYETDEKLLGEVTRELILGENWRNNSFKKYDVTIPVQPEIVAMRHPMRLLLKDIKDVFSRMGFTEISGPIIEPSFWVFDSLFVPQDHPARETQDTFHLSNPSSLTVNDIEHVKTIKKSHVKSWKINWNQKEAESAVLRTQMTSVSVRYIREFTKRFLSGENLVMPQKFFTVGRVFRNENVDYKHLTDFYQCDGIIIGKNLTMANLFDTLSTFYANFGVKTRFKPAYFPFVEPGAEIFAQLEDNGEWLEIGGSGIIRREVTGISRKKISVLALGLGLERMLLIKDKNIKSITEPYSSGLGWLRSRKMV